ncbi:hypothetical protein HDF24_08270 [Mucilaginibacter sp. X4EP1]|uniref:hypothetical protein n=1 Tax=Mucilaginibacter sp. X4EP1 TaxID=2723092 RepID=UPI0021686FF3|nr:hypothetical protein [Mucilaginibacter sp. X4EP1]
MEFPVNMIPWVVLTVCIVPLIEVMPPCKEKVALSKPIAIISGITLVPCVVELTTTLPPTLKFEIVETNIRLLVLNKLTARKTLELPTVNEPQVIVPAPATVVVKVLVESAERTTLLEFCVILPLTASVKPLFTVSVITLVVVPSTMSPFAPNTRPVIPDTDEFMTGWLLKPTVTPICAVEPVPGTPLDQLSGLDQSLLVPPVQFVAAAETNPTLIKRIKTQSANLINSDRQLRKKHFITNTYRLNIA